VDPSVEIRRRVAWWARALAVTLSLACVWVTLPRSASSAPRSVPSLSHVFVVVMENRSYADALADPGVARLAARWALATNYYAVSHPSLPNYLALTGGSTFGVTSDCVTCFVGAPNLLSELAAAHVSAAAYFEGVPGPCYLAPWGGTGFASKHDPFRYFRDVRASRTLCGALRPYSELASVLARPAASVPRFVWVTPNLCNDGHDCSTAVASAWLTRFVARVTASAAWRKNGALFVVWDEGAGSAGVVGARVTPTSGGGQVAALVIAPGIPAGRRVATPLNHYSLLATIEVAFGVARLGHAVGASTFALFFR